MKINTTRFGEIEFPEEVTLRFPEGILGFPGDTTYILLEHDVVNSPFKWLQSADSPELAFIVLDPLLMTDEYRVMIDSDTARIIGTQETSDCAFMSIVNVPESNPSSMTVNLKAPLVVHSAERLGRQVIIGSQAHSMSEQVFPRLSSRLAEINTDHHANEAITA